MGNGNGIEHRLNNQINKEINNNRKSYAQVIKVLLLGTGDSGKSTIFKQTRRFGGKAITENERRHYILPIYVNIIFQMQVMLKATRHMNYKFKAEEEFQAAEAIDNLSENDVIDGLPSEVAEKLQLLWDSDPIQKVWASRADFQIFDSVEYFLEEKVLGRIVNEGKEYLPSFNDILQVRYKTTGVSQEILKINNGIFRFVDVGGQRSERRKWYSLFNNVTTVLFVSSLSEYDQYLYEETTIPRVEDSLNVWSEIVNRDDFKPVAFVLFLNKWDLFQKKLLTIPFRETDGSNGKLIRNTDYTGIEPMECKNDTPDQEEAMRKCAEHMEKLYIDAVDLNDREGGITTHYSVAVDTKNFQVVFKGCVQQIFKDALNGAGF